jgi:hypothetical protein
MPEVLRAGSTGPSVEFVRAALQRNGYDVTRGDRYDEATVAAVELFQLQHIGKNGKPLASDGQITVGGEATWWALQNASGDAQRNHVPAFLPKGLTPTRKRLLEALEAEHSKNVREDPDGSNLSPEINSYFAGTGVIGKAWCCAFVSAMLKRTLNDLPIGNRYWLGVQAMFVEARELELLTTDPKPGDVFVQIKSMGQGHTGFVIGVSPDGQDIFTCEGNCGNRLKRGKRAKSSIHYFIDAVQDEQPPDFERTQGTVENLDAKGTR